MGEALFGLLGITAILFLLTAVIAYILYGRQA